MKNKTWKEKANEGLLKIIVLGIHNIRVYKNRIAIWRIDGKKLEWEELQKIKNTFLGDNIIAIEIFPKKNKEVNLRHTRHLWFSDKITKLIIRDCNHAEFEKELK